MNEKMVHRFCRTAAHTAPIRQREVPKHQIIQGKNPTMGCSPHEEIHPLRNLDFPNLLPWEARKRYTPDLIIERSSVKLTIPIKAPMGSYTQYLLGSETERVLGKRRRPQVPSHENSYKISSSKIYYSYPPDDPTSQKYKLPCHWNTHTIEDRAF